ncbi:nucleotide exchange factor GrpE [Nakamurella lactea]|uniref:nucleotide exchange factor GrpE n=1 Tax=Nakamurella lactea TaxID=459515 RepID=UPI0003F6069C|nr:nucleotide exchange factor GrpE [Nakamurella lactea]
MKWRRQNEPNPANPANSAAADERRQLIELLIYAWDRARSPGVWERLAAGLAEVGVQVLRPDGEPFDPNAHEVGGTEPTDDVSKIDTVAETEVAGFADRGVLIREPVVVVYRRK